MFVIMLRGLGVESFTVYHNSDFYTCTRSMTCKSANTNFDYDIIISYVDGTYHDYLCIEFMKFICDGVPWGYSIVRSIIHRTMVTDVQTMWYAIVKVAVSTQTTQQTMPPGSPTMLAVHPLQTTPH